jgi:hypothetical protein
LSEVAQVDSKIFDEFWSDSGFHDFRFSRISSNGWEHNQILPITSRIITITNTNPRPPDGPYPHFLLCGHAGTAPSKSKMRTTSRTVPNMKKSLTCAHRQRHQAFYPKKQNAEAGPRTYSVRVGPWWLTRCRKNFWDRSQSSSQFRISGHCSSGANNLERNWRPEYVPCSNYGFASGELLIPSLFFTPRLLITGSALKARQNSLV